MGFKTSMGAVALTIALAGCGTVGNVVGSVTGGSGGGVAATEVQPTESATVAQAAGAPIACPAVQIRSGTQGVTRYAGGREGDASAVRHQFSILRSARDCRFQNNTLFLRIGVAGRVILGPSGSAGTVSAPIRFVVARGGVEPVYSETQTVSVSIAPGSTSADFDVVQSNVQVAVRTDETVGNFQIFVGFDE